MEFANRAFIDFGERRYGLMGRDWLLRWLPGTARAGILIWKMGGDGLSHVGVSHVPKRDLCNSPLNMNGMGMCYN